MKKIPVIILIALFICGLFKQMQAQPRKVENLPSFDFRTFHFGFSLGINNSGFVLRHQADLSVFDSLQVVEAQSSPGFQLGIIADYHITPVLNLRFIPTLSFVQRYLEYTFEAPVVNGGPATFMESKSVESTFLEFPLLLKYRSARLNNFAAYVIGGANYRYDLASQEDVSGVFGQELIKLGRHDLAYEIGLGFDFFLEYFKFSPELKMSFGINDILIRDETIWTSPIRRLTSRIFVLSFHFEG